MGPLELYRMRQIEEINMLSAIYGTSVDHCPTACMRCAIRITILTLRGENIAMTGVVSLCYCYAWLLFLYH